MTKLCSVCGTENRDEVQFCRACGTAFTALPTGAPPAADEGQLAAGITCDECGFQNKPGVRYCANCGVSLLGTVVVPRSRTGGASAADDPLPGASPPPISYPSFAPVAPYPPAPAEAPYHDHAYPPVYDDTAATADIPDPDAALTARAPAAYDAQSTSPTVSAATPATSRAPLLVGAVVLLLAAAGAGAWWYMSGSNRSLPVAAGASAPTLPASVAAPAPIPVEPAPIPIEPAPAAVAVEAAPASSPFAPFATGAASAAVAVEASASEVEAKRVAAEKRREKAAKDKADREAKAKALADEQQATAAAAARSEQEAQARRRAEEAQRQRTPATPAAPQATAAQPRGVREICAGRGTIAEAICQSRQCGAPEHAGEAVCKQIREADERRRNYNN